MAFLVNAALEYLITGVEPQKWGSEHAQQVPYKAFKTGDGWAVIAAGFPNLYAAFCRLLGREDLITDPRFADMGGRVTHREVLYGILDAEVAKHRPTGSSPRSMPPKCRARRSTTCSRYSATVR